MAGVNLRRVMLSFIFILILIFQTLNTQFYAGTGNKSSAAVDQSDSVREGEIKHNNNSGGVYRDGIIDPFDNFTNTGFPTAHGEFCFRYSSC